MNSVHWWSTRGRSQRFITANMSNDEVQRYLLAETKSPEQALHWAVRRKEDLENQIHIRKQGTSGIQKGSRNIKSNPLNFAQKGQLQVSNAVWKWSRRNGTKQRHRQVTTKLNLFQMWQRIFSESPLTVLGTRSNL